MDKDTRKKTDLVIKIVLIIIIILLLIRNCTLLKEKDTYHNVPGDNIDIVEIKCDDDNCDISKQIDDISFVQRKFNVKKGGTIRLVAIIRPSELAPGEFTWESSNPSIATIDENGVVKGIKPGKVTITATSSNGKKTTCTVEVVTDSVGAKEIVLTPSKKTIDVGSTTQVVATIKPENATERDLIWTSSNSNIATVDENGVVKGKSAGTVTITAKTKDGKVVASTTITVKEKSSNQIESLSFSQNKVAVKKDDTLKLTVTVKPSNLSSNKLTWKSSDPSIATVNENGVVKGIKPGKVTITVTSSNGKTATCTVEVVTDDVLVEEIILTPNESTIDVGSTTQINALVKPENATNRELVWSSSNPNVATVDENGVVKGKSAGTVTITAKTKDGKVVASTTITIEETTTGDFEVYDNDHNSIVWNGASDLKIFTNSLHTMEGRIAPESSDVYQFMIKNDTAYNMKYQIKFIETNNYNINMKYKLKKNDTYIVDHYVKASELSVSDMILNVNENDTYYLEWKWISSNNDTSIGENPEAKYGLKIEVEAEGTND